MAVVILKSSEVRGAFAHFCLFFLYSSQSPLRSCCKEKLRLHFFFKSFYQLLRVFSSKFGTLLFILIFVATP